MRNTYRGIWLTLLLTATALAGPQRPGRARLGEAGTDLHRGPRLHERLHRGRRLGRSHRAQLQEAGLWLLGWRPDVPGAARGDGAGDVDVEERFEPGG